MNDNDRLLQEVIRLRTISKFKDSVQLIEMESRAFRRRRAPYAESLRKLAREKADVIVQAENCVSRLALSTDENAQLIDLLADEILKECRDSP